MFPNALRRLSSRLATASVNDRTFKTRFLMAGHAKLVPKESKALPKSHELKKENIAAKKKNSEPSLKDQQDKKVWSKKKRETLFGIHPVEICLSERKRTIYKVFCSKIREDTVSNESLQRILNIASARKIPIKSVETRQLNLMTNKATHQGIGMQVSPLILRPWNDAMECFGQSDDNGQLCIYVDRVQDPMNMGAILRTAVFLGIDGIFVPTENSCRLSPVVAKASAGALECAPLYSVENPASLFTFLQRLGWDIVGSDQDCEPYTAHKHPKFSIWRLGNSTKSTPCSG
ncbi:rRNA methyltransferase 1, mitochondrial-like isoform X2 [Varroa destructor]|uniref:rRNA methyltransferase 1, mitochondrial n=1 Tax=Varroa destructor TaxID=109461 RepID=A0A7M7J922_VARDE|nr:rRNA methyltransferase 1, mitochondrial-like isoform X2 [Varroa destructor]